MGSFGRTLYPSLFFAIAAGITKNGSIAVLAMVGGVASIIVSVGLTKGERPPSPNLGVPKTTEVSSNSLTSRISLKSRIIWQ